MKLKYTSVKKVIRSKGVDKMRGNIRENCPHGSRVYFNDALEDIKNSLYYIVHESIWQNHFYYVWDKVFLGAQNET